MTTMVLLGILTLADAATRLPHTPYFHSLLYGPGSSSEGDEPAWTIGCPWLSEAALVRYPNGVTAWQRTLPSMTDMTQLPLGALEYKGALTLPGELEPRAVSLLLDNERQVVTVRFDAPVAGANDWEGTSVSVAGRPKYHEVAFRTIGLPKGAVELVWKVNASLADNTLAGVVAARPNEERVTGEKGFSLTRPT